jgi:hypothetical protein
MANNADMRRKFRRTIDAVDWGDDDEDVPYSSSSSRRRRSDGRGGERKVEGRRGEEGEGSRRGAAIPPSPSPPSS